MQRFTPCLDTVKGHDRFAAGLVVGSAAAALFIAVVHAALFFLL